MRIRRNSICVELNIDKTHACHGCGKVYSLVEMANGQVEAEDKIKAKPRSIKNKCRQPWKEVHATGKPLERSKRKKLLLAYPHLSNVVEYDVVEYDEEVINKFCRKPKTKVNEST